MCTFFGLIFWEWLLIQMSDFDMERSKYKNGWMGRQIQAEWMNEWIGIYHRSNHIKLPQPHITSLLQPYN